MIDLARCDDFDVGSVTVRPSSRELVAARGPVMLEPKVMQLLVALARADGRVVSRDALVAQCWNGRVVGDDAINRILGKLRRVAEALDPPAFRIETVARTGYRLVRAADLAAEPVTQADAAPALGRRRSRWWWLVPAVGAAALLGLAQPWRGHDARVPDPVRATMPAAVSDLETRGLSAMFENAPEQTAEGVAYLRQATALAPRSGPVWGSLAMSYVLSLGWTAPAERAAVAARVRDAAAHGLALDPRDSRSAAALVSVEPTFGRWAAKDAAIAEARRRARPDLGPLAYQHVQFLVAVGRCREALAEIERIYKISPLVPWIRAMRIDLLAAANRLDEADRAAESARTLWPRDRLIWFTRFDLAAFHGQPDRALAMASDRAAWPKQTTAVEMALAARTARALVTRDPAKGTRVIDDLQSAAPAGQAGAERAMRVAAALGRTDLALAAAWRLFSGTLAAQPRATMLPLIGFPRDRDPPTAALFLPPGSLLLSDPGAGRLLAGIGLAAYWQRSGAPDFQAGKE